MPRGRRASATTRIFSSSTWTRTTTRASLTNEVFAYIESPVIRRQAVESAKRGARASMLGGTIGYQDLGGRLTRHELRRDDIRRHDKLRGGDHRDVAMTPGWVGRLGGGYFCLLPPPMAFL